mmetsp:Transcript_24596/g.53731  ORF Transcript_24596/g.53731 Transcript_24596/m.53731 type:complete len:222 (-) Transcript_24596:271-936(-)
MMLQQLLPTLRSVTYRACLICNRSFSSTTEQLGNSTDGTSSPAETSGNQSTAEILPGKLRIDELRQASPSGRLLDLLAQQSRETSPTSPSKPSLQTGVSTSQQAAPEADLTDVTRIILQAVENCKPLMKVQPVKSGTKIMYVPKVVKPGEQRSLAIRWIVQAANKRRDSAPKEKKKPSLAECLALELLLAYRKQGDARKKRDDMHLQALDNRSNVAGVVTK